MSDAAPSMPAATLNDDEADKGIGPDGRPWVRVTLEDGSKIKIRKPLGGDYRGAPMSECYRMDVVALGKVISRVSEPTISAQAFLTMDGADCAKLGGEIVNFLLSKADKAEAGLTE